MAVLVDANQMGRTIPSCRTVLEMEKEEWKPYSCRTYCKLYIVALMQN